MQTRGLYAVHTRPSCMRVIFFFVYAAVYRIKNTASRVKPIGQNVFDNERIEMKQIVR